MFDVCCLGILVADVSAIPVNRLPETGRIQNVDAITLGVGGCAANAAIDLVKLGMRAAVIGKVGDDTYGSYMMDTLGKSGVAITGLKKSAMCPTSTAVVLVNDSGERSFLHCPGSNADFALEDIDFSIIFNSRMLFVAGSLLMPALDGEPTAKLLKKAKEEGVYTVLDTAWDTRGKWMDSIAPSLAYINLFIPSIDEAKMISGENDVSMMADAFLRRGVELCVIKMGKAGCYLKSNSGDQFFSSGYDRVPVKDTNGAGDSFVAGFLTGLLNGWDLQACAQFANAVGAHCVSSIGATTGIKTIGETMKFMREYQQGSASI